EDVIAIESGYRARDSLLASVGTAVIRNLKELADSSVLSAAVSNLAWLVTHSVIDIKVAVPIREGEVLRGIYHEKLGFFRDATGHLVCFQGSANESEQAVWSNFESLWIYTNWPGVAHSDYYQDVARM